MMKRQWPVLVLGVVLIVATCWALWQPGFFFIHDYTHGARLGEMARGLAAGHLPVRWSANFGYGFGMPLYQFYAPLPYYLGAIGLLSGLDLILVLKLLWLICAVVTIWGAYRLGAALGGIWSGLVLAALYTMAPYRAVNLYVRGALSEAWGMMALPWICWSVIITLQGKKWGWLSLAGWLSVLALSHNLSALLFVPVLALFTILMSFTNPAGQLDTAVSQRQRLRHTWPKLLIAGLVALGLSAFYVVPSYFEKDFTQVESTITQDYFDYHLHFVYIRQLLTPYWGYGGSGWGIADDGLSFFIGWGALVGLAVTLLILFWLAVQRQWRSIVVGIGLATIAAGAFFLSLGRSLLIWENLEFLKFVQFPWRWLGPAALGVALLSAWAVAKLPRRWQPVVAVGLILVAVIGGVRYFQPERWLDDPAGLYYLEPSRIQLAMSNTLRDYLPETFSSETDLTPPSAIVLCGEGELCVAETQTLLNRVHERLVAVKLEQPTLITWQVAAFPGWQTELDGQMVSHTVTPDGLIAVEVPAGEHILGLRFTNTPLRALSDGVTAVTIISLLVWGVWQTRSKPTTLSTS